VLSLDWFFVIFRAIHITGGVLWVGMVFFFVVFLQPSAAAIGPAAGPIMTQLLGVRKLSDRILAIGVATVLAGLVLWIRHAADLGLGTWLSTAYGVGLTIGMVAALIALAIGGMVTKPNIGKLMALQGQIAAGGGPPTPEQGASLTHIQGTLKVAARVGLALLLLTTLTMATARYW
jgi:hypothetical protein